MRAAFLLLTLSAPAQAACPGETLFSCTIGPKTVQVCHDAGSVTYSFGPKDAPELTLTEPLGSVAATRWPENMNATATWETVEFFTNGTFYEVWTGLDADLRDGGVKVRQGTTLIADLACDPDTATPMDRLSVLKQGLGQCWDPDSQGWTPSCT